MRTKKPGIGCGGALLVCVAVIVGGGLLASLTHQGAPAAVAQPPSAVVQDTPVPTPVPSVAYRLAVIQSSTALDQNDPLVAQFQSALDALGPKCTEPENKLSDFAVVVHKDMAKRGVDESYLSILTHVRASIPESMTLSEPCAGIFAAYATLRLDG